MGDNRRNHNDEPTFSATDSGPTRAARYPLHRDQDYRGNNYKDDDLRYGNLNMPGNSSSRNILKEEKPEFKLPCRDKDLRSFKKQPQQSEQSIINNNGNVYNINCNTITMNIYGNVYNSNRHDRSSSSRKSRDHSKHKKKYHRARSNKKIKKSKRKRRHSSESEDSKEDAPLKAQGINSIILLTTESKTCWQWMLG